MNTENKSSVKKHLFYSAYKQICSRDNYIPITAVRPKNNNLYMLDFYADRIKYDDWIPILLALEHDKSLHLIGIHIRKHAKRILETVDSELKCRKITNLPILLTKYVLLCTLDTIRNCLLESPILSCLILEGIPLTPDYLKILTDALSKNHTIQHLSLKYCLIGDDGCNTLCKILRKLPNILTIDLTGCNITKEGATFFAGLLKYQTLMRYTENWKETLRYRPSDLNALGGLRRITLNENRLKDSGIRKILEILHDDLWLKALDLQNCHLTNQGAEHVLDTVRNNTTIDLIDIRCNKKVEKEIIKAILKTLDRPAYGNADKYEWLSTPPEFVPKEKLYRMKEKIAVDETPQYDMVEDTEITPKETLISISQEYTKITDIPPSRKRWRPKLSSVSTENFEKVRLNPQNDLYLEVTEDNTVRIKTEELNEKIYSDILLNEKYKTIDTSQLVDTNRETICGISDVLKSFVELIDKRQQYMETPQSSARSVIDHISLERSIRSGNSSSFLSKSFSGCTSESTSEAVSYSVKSVSSKDSVTSSSVTPVTVIAPATKRKPSDILLEMTNKNKYYSRNTSECSLSSSSASTSGTSIISIEEALTPKAVDSELSGVPYKVVSSIPEMLIGLLKKTSSSHSEPLQNKNISVKKDIKSESGINTKMKIYDDKEGRKTSAPNIIEKSMGDVLKNEGSDDFLTKKYTYSTFHED